MGRQLTRGVSSMIGWVNLDREQLTDMASFLVSGIGAMAVLLLALS